ncbi:unnamed protein product [Brassica napus]|uniref:(rape) hypothetical protein n=1 Tax=Brassica napus TaxID=3708 RepID=A0A816RHN5_BRANA|nr:unnamed protein product [Brassica napus]
MNRSFKSYDRAVEMLAEVESKDPEDGLSDKFYAGCSFANGTMKENKAPRNAKHEPLACSSFSSIC